MNRGPERTSTTNAEPTRAGGDPAAPAMSERSARPAADDLEALPYSSELLRKGLHLFALVIPAGMWMLGRSLSVAILLPLAAVAVGADVLRSRSHGFATFIEQIFGRMLRRRELPSDRRRVVLNGATWVLISAAVMSLIFPTDLAAPAFASFMVADAAAALVGARFGRMRWHGTKRTLEGSMAFGVVAFLCLLPFDHVPVAGAVTTALAGAATEIPERPLNDNIRVPVVMAAMLLIWSL